jgi:vitamin B12 transporter
VQAFARVQASFDCWSSQWQHTLGVSQSSIDGEYKDPDSRSTFDSTITKIDWQHNLYAWEPHVLTLGFDAQREAGESASYGAYSDEFDRETADTASVYAQDFVKFGPYVSAVAGARFDDYEHFGHETTYRVAPVVAIGESGFRVKGSYGTGFKAPSLYQLYSPYGDKNLHAEKSIGWDGGVEWSAEKRRTVVSATWFDNVFSDMIDFDLVDYKYYNVDGKTTTHGLEFEASHEFSEVVSVSAGYTYTKTNKEETDTELYRRPRDRLYADVVCRFGKAGSLSVGAVYVGKRMDRDLSGGEDVTLDPYTLVNIRATVALSKRVEIFGRLENALDEDYEEAIGYGTAGQSFYGGVRWTL